jgi:hypothetical protein
VKPGSDQASGNSYGSINRPLPCNTGLSSRLTKTSRGWARIPGILDVEYEGILGFDGSASWLDNLRHFVSRRLYTCRSTRSIFKDHGMDWNNAGRNAYYTSFEWAGP